MQVQYEAWTNAGRWHWYTATWTFRPGETATLNHDGWKVNARRVRITGKSPTGQWVSHKDKDLWLAPQDGYRAADGMGTYTFTFNP